MKLYTYIHAHTHTVPISLNRVKARLTHIENMEDPVYLSDELVLRRMLDSETHHGMGSYFDSRLQKDFNENDRQELAIWMRDVCRAEECQPDIFPLSIQIVDRFLSFVRTKRSQLQLLGAVAMFTASKLRQTRIIPARNLIYYTQDLLTLQELRTWELFVLTTLKWDIALITPVDYLDILLRRVKLPDDDDLTSEIEYEAHKLIHECCLGKCSTGDSLGHIRETGLDSQD